MIDEDPRTEITLSHVGEVYRAGQYRLSLPYSDGNYSTAITNFIQVKRLKLLMSETDFLTIVELAHSG